MSHRLVLQLEKEEGSLGILSSLPFFILLSLAFTSPTSSLSFVFILSFGLLFDSLHIVGESLSRQRDP